MIVLGLNAYHGDAAACLMAHGKVLAAVEEERITRHKHSAGFPLHAVRACLDGAALAPQALDAISIAKNPQANLGGRLGKLAQRLRQPRQLARDLPRIIKSAGDLKGQVAAALAIPPKALRARIIPVEHHLAHVASAFFYGCDEAAVGVSVDGMGDNVSTLITRCEGRSITRLGEVQYPHSLGFYYTALTQYLGFPHYGDEYKVMGLAAAGRPRYVADLRRLIQLDKAALFRLNLAYFVHHRQGIEMAWESGAPSISKLYSQQLIALLGPARQPDDPIEQHHKDIACSVQAVYEEALLHVLSEARRRSDSDVLALAGGCSQNSLANGRVPRTAGFRKVYVPPSGHDGGTALGAALYASAMQGAPLLRDRSPFLGRSISDQEALTYLQGAGLRWLRMDEAELLAAVIDCVAAGGVVGWVQGRAEWGPRALGNRSILADPRRADMQAILNDKIKRRESFRPFAPSLPIEAGDAWFVLDSTTAAAPYMEKVVPVQEPAKTRIPAVVHCDGTARIHLVERELNERYWRLLWTMGDKTGVPILLNTSFNENEPMVDSAKDAIDCFTRTRMDMLVINNIVLRR